MENDMKDLYIECSNGIDENSLLSALYEISGAGEEFLERLNAIGFKNISVKAEKDSVSGIGMTRFRVDVEEEESIPIEDLFPVDGLYAFEAGYAEYVKQVEMQNARRNTPARGYGVRNFGADEEEPEEAVSDMQAEAYYDTPGQVFQIINSFDISDDAKVKIKEIYDSVFTARAELADVHYSKVRLSEEGELKAILYTSAIAMLLEMMNAGRIVASEVNIGSGSVTDDEQHCPVPNPVTAELLKNTPVFSDTSNENMTSIMAAAILKYYCSEFTAEKHITYTDVGYGVYENEGGKRYTRVFCGNME